MKKFFAWLWVFLLWSNAAFATTRNVGSGQTYATVALAVAAAAAGDSVIIHGPITLNQDWVTINHDNLKMVMMDSQGHFPGDPNFIATDMPIFDAQGTSDPGSNQGIWRTGNDAVRGTSIWRLEVNGGEFRNAQGSGNNACAVRVQAGMIGLAWFHNLYAHDNQMNFLAAPESLIIENSKLYHALRVAGGNQHNLYANAAGNGDTTSGKPKYLRMKGVWTDDATTGNDFKSRFPINYFLYNRITDGVSDSLNANIDVPDMGLTYVIGNVIEQGTGHNINSVLVGYGRESAGNATGGAGHVDGATADSMFCYNNTFSNLNTSIGIFFQTSFGSPVVTYDNNIFYGFRSSMTTGGGVYTDGGHNFSEADLNNTSTKFLNQAGGDYHLTAATSSSIIDAGLSPGTHSGFACAPTSQYVYDRSTATRTTSGSAIDIGAFEFSQSGGGGGGGGGDPCTPW